MLQNASTANYTLNFTNVTQLQFFNYYFKFFGWKDSLLQRYAISVSLHYQVYKLVYYFQFR
jgi:hypothetical protein